MAHNELPQADDPSKINVNFEQVINNLGQQIAQGAADLAIARAEAAAWRDRAFAAEARLQSVAAEEVTAAQQ